MMVLSESLLHTACEHLNLSGKKGIMPDWSTKGPNSHVERLWQLDVLPFQNEKQVNRSKQDQLSLQWLEAGTVRLMVDGVQ